MASNDPGPRGAFPITFRSILIGAFGMGLIALVHPYLAYVRGTWEIGFGSLLSGVVLLLFLLVAANGLLARLTPGRELTRTELLVAYAMMIIAGHLIHCGGLPFMVGATTYPIYRATPSNGWEQIIWPHIPPQLRLNNPAAVTWFWEGLPQGTGMPWGPWLTPMAYWGAFTVALAAGMFCLGALLSKDWVEAQRLTYPLVDVPLAVVGEKSRPTILRTMFSNRIFLVGFAIPAGVAVLSFLHAIYPNVPAPQLYNIRFGPYFQGMGLPWTVFSGHWDLRISIIFSVIGITCLLPSEVSLSLWLFYVIYRVQQLVWASFGVADEGGTTAIAISPREFIGFMEAGGFIALSAIILWQSRHALRAAWLSLVGRADPEPDPYGPLQKRWSLLGFIAANAFMFWWAMHAGVSWWAFGLLLGTYYAVLLGCARLVAAGGVMYTDTGAFPRGIITRTVGALNLNMTSLTVYAYISVIFTYDPNTVMLPQIMNSLKLLHTGRVRGKGFPLAAFVALVIAFVVGGAALLWVVYHYGASALRPWPFTSYPSWAFSELEASMHRPEPADNWLRLALGLGAGVTCLLVWLHSRFLWWPVRPIRFLIASSYETNRSLWFSVFIAWAVTTVIRRYGGLRLYRALRPAFLGLVLGDFLVKGVLGLISTFFGHNQSLSFG